ncbi:MAG: HYC_CC_PP family protein [Ginsengibacter sp.]
MKKFTAIILISIYAVATMGFSMKEFYCCGKLKKVTIAVVDQKDNCKKGDSNTDGCCNNKFHYFKVKDNHLGAVNVALTNTQFTSLHILNTCFQNSIFSSLKTVIAYKSNAPPFHRSVPVYIANCVYLI